MIEFRCCSDQDNAISDLNIKLLSIPVIDQYQQQCNATALAQLGIKVLKDLNEETKQDFYEWVAAPKIPVEMKANDIKQTFTLPVGNG
ncbi:MAG: hypothetical protein ABJB16_07935 [Saprospiraceae bacterium]